MNVPTAYPTSWRTPLRRLRQRLGFCFWCWRRSDFHLDFNGYNDAGELTSTTPYECCTKHAKEGADLMKSGPHQAHVEFKSGATLDWTVGADEEGYDG